MALPPIVPRWKPVLRPRNAATVAIPAVASDDTAIDASTVTHAVSAAAVATAGASSVLAAAPQHSRPLR